MAFYRKGICASLFACFVYFDLIQTAQICQWLYWAPLNRRAIAEGKVSFQWKNPDVPFKDPDLLSGILISIENVAFIIKTRWSPGSSRTR